MKIKKTLMFLSFVVFASSWEYDPSGLDEDITGAMNVHNEAREEVGVNAVVWSSSLASTVRDSRNCAHISACDKRAFSQIDVTRTSAR